ncbi:MAG: hypothetical protein ABL921_06250 [Pirellula sp.]
MIRTSFILVIVCILSLNAFGQDKVFSGPQVGEPLVPFKVRGVYDQDAGREIDFVSEANGKAIVLVFVHELNRQSIGFTRSLTQYTRDRAKDGLTTGVVWLDDDATEAEITLKRIKHGFAEKVPIGISVDGREGPGAYGLNRKVMLTILVGKENKVTGNYALVQPSLQSDLIPIVEKVVSHVGGSVPKLETLIGTNANERMQPKAATSVPDLRPYIAPVISRAATQEDVARAAKVVVEFVEKNEGAKTELGRIATTIVNSGRLETYGTPAAQEYLAKWAKEYGIKPDTPKAADTPISKGGESKDKADNPRDRK